MKEPRINIFLNDKNTCFINCLKDSKLDEIRKLISDKIKENYSFLDSDGNIVENEDEKDYSVNYILSKESIKLTNNSIKNVPPASSIINSDKGDIEELTTKIKQNKEKLDNKKDIENSKLIKVYLDGKQITLKKFKINYFLHNIRKINLDKISDSSLFILENGDKIENSDESSITLTDILIDNKKIYMTSKIKKILQFQELH